MNEGKGYDVIATLSQKLMIRSTLTKFAELGATIFRINGSHTSVSQIPGMVKKIRAYTGKKAKILIDLPGSKVRLNQLTKPVKVHAGRTFQLRESNFNYHELPQLLTKDHLLIANDGTLPFRLVKKKQDRYVFEPLLDGTLHNGRGINIRGEYPPIPFLHDVDFQIAKKALELEIDFLGFSYIRTPNDVKQAFGLIKNSKTQAICKVETREACERLSEIIPLTKTILIDRGDLASEIGIHETPGQVRRIIRCARKFNNRIYIATQFLHYMVNHPIPSISEITALHEALSLTHGIQLSEETAIGKYPFRVLSVIREGLEMVKRRKQRARFAFLPIQVSAARASK